MAQVTRRVKLKVLSFPGTQKTRSMALSQLRPPMACAHLWTVPIHGLYLATRHCPEDPQTYAVISGL